MCLRSSVAHLGNAESLGSCDHRSVDCAEWEVSISADEFGDAYPVGRCDGLGDEVARSEIAEEADLSVDAEAARDEVGNLGDHQGQE
jgi:hypothetical protein